MARTGVSCYLERLKSEYPDFPRYIEGLEARRRFVIKERLKGRTLEEIGAELPRSPRVGGGIGVKRERVRQLEAKACRSLIWRCSHM